MRASIPHPLRERLPHPLRERIPRRLRERRHSRRGRGRAASANDHAIAPSPASAPADLAVERVRDAGGPVDRASYSCQCGYVFLAPVSTTVTCPHCESRQAW